MQTNPRSRMKNLQLQVNIITYSVNMRRDCLCCFFICRYKQFFSLFVAEETKKDQNSDSSSSDKSHDDSKSSSSEEDSGCPDDWTRFGQQCFIFINSPKTWAEAESYCQFDGSNLASIHSYEENHFLQSLTRADTHNFPQAWIGGTDTMHFGLWTWSDGSRFLYENWSYKGKDGDADRCLKINYHYELKWTAARCSESLPFVCSKNAEKENEA
uniref:C-type lectin domain-containing protein n=1 Tax=Oryzias latipes TaxID=8090 RepID=A0A3P9IGF2_ORYLA